MSLIVYSLNVPTSVASGAAQDVGALRDKTVQVSGTFVATVQLEGSVDGVQWAPMGAADTAAAIRTLPESVRYVRARTTAFTSGTPAVKVAGYAGG